MVYPKSAGKQEKEISGYKIKIKKRKYPNHIYNYCYLVYKGDKYNLGDPVGDLRKNETIRTIKTLIQHKILEIELGKEKLDGIFESQEGFEIFDWLDKEENINMENNFIERFKKKCGGDNN